jgi:hypothetical protein
MRRAMFWGCAFVRKLSPLAGEDAMVMELVYFIIGNDCVGGIGGAITNYFELSRRY